MVAPSFLILQLHIHPCGGKAKNSSVNCRAIFLFSIKSRLSLGFSQFPLQRVKRALSPRDARCALSSRDARCALSPRDARSRPEAGAEGQE